MIGRGVFSLLALLLGYGAASADSVVLRDGSGFEIEGEVLSYDGEFYAIQTEAGPLTLAGSGLICQGDACPTPSEVKASLFTSDEATRRLFIGLLRGFSRDMGAVLEETYGANGIEEMALSDSETGEMARFILTAGPAEWSVLRNPDTRPGAGRTDTALAFDGLVPAVSVENPVTGLTLLSVRAAVAGEFPDWSGLGGNGSRVRVHWAEELEAPFVGRYGFRPGPTAIRYADVLAAADAVGRDPAGIGLLPLSEIGTAVPLVVTAACGRGALGTSDAVRTGDYPLSELIVLRRPAKRQPPFMRAFLRWVEATDSRKVVRRAGFIDLGVGPVSDALDGRQEADAVSLSFSGEAATEAARGTLAEATRLNVAMRFQDGSSLPDRVARLQISRLVSAIEAGDFRDRDLLFVGFSDADGAAETNLRLSQRRAEAIRGEVVAAIAGRGGVARFEAVGLGEAMPVACNGVDWGERLNRRVEVWVSDP